LLVVGGTLAGVFLAFPTETLRELWAQIQRIFRTRVMTLEEMEELFVLLTRTRRDEGVRAMENTAQRTGHPFLIMGVSLVADERPAPYIRQRLEQEFDFFSSRRESQRAALTMMGRLAPAFGLAGTIIGLIRMLSTIKDPTGVAEGMSAALLTTFYGIMLANLFVLPLERKFREVTRSEAVEITLLTEGVMGLVSEENGAAISARLRSFRFARPQPHPSTRQGGAAVPALLRNPIKKAGKLVRSLRHER
jgi:chemotaxis protein MotA